VIVALSVTLRFFRTLAAEASEVMGVMKLRGVCLSLGNAMRHPLRMIEYFTVGGADKILHHASRLGILKMLFAKT
jgi:hypothetical protein